MIRFILPVAIVQVKRPAAETAGVIASETERHSIDGGFLNVVASFVPAGTPIVIPVHRTAVVFLLPTFAQVA